MFINLLFILFGFVPGYYFSKLWYQEHKHIRKFSRLGRHKGYHFHHSMYGVVILLILPFVQFKLVIELFLSSFSVAVIFDHTLREGFIFITREANDHVNKLLLSYYFLLLSLPNKSKISALIA